MTRLDDFLVLVAIETDECVLWPHAVDKDGYGRLSTPDRRNTRTHIVACEQFHGHRPSGTECTHRCGKPACLNPRHLRWATHAVNIADKKMHGTQAFGERNARTKLTAQQVTEIRDLAVTVGRRELARRYRTTHQNVRLIVEGRTWAWLEPKDLADQPA